MHRITVQYETPNDPDGFEEKYTDEHIPLVRDLPGLERFTLSRPRPLGSADTGVPYLVAEMWFADADAMKAALRSPQMAAAGEHAADLGAKTVMFTAEQIEAESRVASERIFQRE